MRRPNLCYRLKRVSVYQQSPEKVRAMGRTEWRKQMRDRAEKLYDGLSPLYWVKYGRS